MPDLLSKLVQEHREVEALLDRLADSEEGAERQQLLTELESSLATHMAVEEQFVYPLVKQHLEAEKAEEANNEHDLAREGVAKAKELASEPGFGAAIEMLKGGITHHVHEEEGELFPELRAKAQSDIDALGDPVVLESKVQASTGQATKDELYEQAKELDIEGRSTMTKEELQKAVARQQA
jgi:iron-sulfur cluster repair protein YtfE (RIC family)